MSKTLRNEIELLKDSIQGDSAAFETLVKNYQSLVCAITYSATGDVGKSEELAQETFINAWKGLAQLKDLGKFRNWLSGITRNIIRNSFRSQKRDVLDKAVSMDQIGDIGIMQSEPTDATITQQQQEAVRQSLQQIPTKYREPLVLFYRQEQSVKAVAEQLELSEEAVRMRLSRGRKQLKEQVEAMVETTISRTGPSKTFTTAVIASISGMAIKGSVVAATAGIVATTSTTSAATGVTAIMSGFTAKIIATAAVVAIGAGAVVTYQQVTEPDQEAALIETANKEEVPEENNYNDLSAKIKEPLEAEILNDPAGNDKRTIADISILDNNSNGSKADEESKTIITTQENSQNISGWLIDRDDNVVSGTIFLGSQKSETQKDGASTLREPEHTEFFPVFGRAYNQEQTLGCLFIWGRGQRDTGNCHENDGNNAEVILEPMASVSGSVVDRLGDPVSDFKLGLTVYIKEDLVYKSSLGKMPWKDNITTDGFFDINFIPVGLPFQLKIKKPGFKTLVKLDNLTGGRNLELGQITLEPMEGFDEDTQWNCVLEGYIVDENNESLAGAKFSAHFADERIEITSDEEGWYEFKNLPQDVSVQIIPFFEGYGYNPFHFTCSEPNNSVDIQIFPPAYDWYDSEAPGLFVKEWINTEPITLEDLRGQVVLLHIGIDLSRYPKNTKSLQYLRFLKQIKGVLKKHEQSPLTVIGIHIYPSSWWIKEDNIRKFVEEYDIDFPFAIDAAYDVIKDIILSRKRPWDENIIRVPRKTFGQGAMSSLYEVKANPAYYLIDKNGILRVSPAQSDLEEWIEYLLAE